MKELTEFELISSKGGFWKTFLAGLSGAAGVLLGKDVGEIWKEGWNDPYGKD